MTKNHGWSAKFFVLGNLVFASLLAAGIVHTVKNEGRPPRLYIGYIDEHQALIDSNKERESLPEFRTAAAIDFDNATAQLRLLFAAYEVRDIENVAFALKGLLSHTPNDADLHNQLAVVLLEMGKPDEALLHIGRAVKLDPENAAFRTTYGAILMGLGRLDEAAQNYRKALELDPQSESAIRALQFPLKNY